jgi:hypothetical protein
MPDTVRTIAQLLTLFADNTSGQISAQDGRDFIVTVEARTLGVPVRRLTTGASTALVYKSDYLLVVDKTTGSATTVNLPATPAAGYRFEVKDGKGDSHTNNITVLPASGTIDDQASYIISNAYGAATFTYDGTQWVVT